MSVKKNKAKKHAHHKKNDDHSEQKNKDRDAIKKMVGDIPELIRKEGYFDKKTQSGAVHPTVEENNTENDIAHLSASSGRSEQSERRGNLFVEESYIENNEIDEQKKSIPIVVTHPQKRLWLWTGVIIITMVIFGIWMLNMKNIFYDIRNSKGFEESIIGSSKQDFNDIWKTMKINDEKMQEQVEKNDAQTATTTNKSLNSLLDEIITPLVNTSSMSAELNAKTTE